MEVDPPEACGPLKERLAVIHKNLRDGIAVPLLARKMKSGHDARVLIKTGAFRQSAQCPFNRTHPRIKLLVGRTLFVDTGEREQASVSAALEGEGAGADKARNRDNARSRSGPGEPRRMFQLLSICAGHSRTSG